MRQPEPADPKRPVVCFDESPTQLIGEVRQPIPPAAGQPERSDCEYRRNGTANLFVFLDAHQSWRHVKVTEQRTARDFAVVSLSAPLAGATTTGAMPGMLFGSTTTRISSFSGSSTSPIIGVVYIPTGEVDLSGGTTPRIPQCREIFAGSIKISGSAGLSGACSGDGAISFGSQPGSTVISLVQ